MTDTVQKQDGMSDLRGHLREVIAEPTDLIKQGTAPPPYIFTFEPSGKSEEEAQNFAALLGGSALGRLFAGMNLVRSSPDHGGDGNKDGTKHYSLNNPSEYVAAFNEKTEALINAFTNGPLASMYRQGDGGTTSSLDLECTRAELHAKVLPRIFGGLKQVGEAHLAELDKVLTGFTAALKPFKLPTPLPSQGEDGKDGSPQSPDLKLAVQVNYVKSIDITGGSGGIYIHKPFTRIVIFTVKPQQWASALQKTPKKDSPPDETAAHDKTGHDHDHHADKGGDAAVTTAAIGLPSWLGGKPKPKPPKPDEKIKFTLNTTVLELEFDDAKYRANKSKFEGIFKGMAEDDEELGLIANEGGLEALGRHTCQIYQENEA